MPIYKIEADDDKMYIEAESEEGAIQKLFNFTGPIPRKLLTVSTVPKLPKGEELL